MGKKNKKKTTITALPESNILEDFAEMDEKLRGISSELKEAEKEEKDVTKSIREGRDSALHKSIDYFVEVQKLYNTHKKDVAFSGAMKNAISTAGINATIDDKNMFKLYVRGVYGFGLHEKRMESVERKALSERLKAIIFLKGKKKEDEELDVIVFLKENGGISGVADLARKKTKSKSKPKTAKKWDIKDDTGTTEPSERAPLTKDLLFILKKNKSVKVRNLSEKRCFLIKEIAFETDE